MTTLYREVLVWKMLAPAQAVRYRCFENLGTGRFHVQSADFLRLNDPQDRQFDRQVLELFVESEPADRSAGYATLSEAIAAHDQDFQNFPSASK